MDFMLNVYGDYKPCQPVRLNSVYSFNGNDYLLTRFLHFKRCTDEFIKERERYAIIGDDLDIAFVGQICISDCFIWLSSATLKLYLFRHV